MRPAILFVLIPVLCVLLLHQNAHAYLDPSSGSILIQILLGGVAGLFVLVRIYWRRIRRALGLYKTAASESAQQQDADNDQS